MGEDKSTACDCDPEAYPTGWIRSHERGCGCQGRDKHCPSRSLICAPQPAAKSRRPSGPLSEPGLGGPETGVCGRGRYPGGFRGPFPLGKRDVPAQPGSSPGRAGDDNARARKSGRRALITSRAVASSWWSGGSAPGPQISPPAPRPSLQPPNSRPFTEPLMAPAPATDLPRWAPPTAPPDAPVGLETSAPAPTWACDAYSPSPISPAQPALFLPADRCAPLFLIFEHFSSPFTQSWSSGIASPMCREGACSFRARPPSCILKTNLPEGRARSWGSPLCPSMELVTAK